MRLYRSPDLTAVGYLANIVRERLNGNRAYYVYNQHINYSNFCTNSCRFCAFSRKAGQRDGYRMSVDEIVTKVKERLDVAQAPVSDFDVGPERECDLAVLVVDVYPEFVAFFGDATEALIAGP